MDIDRLELNIIVSGNVQGVFFRATVKKIAEDFAVCGFVKNLENGDVFIAVQGEKETLYAFLDVIRRNPGSAIIKSIDITEKKLSTTYSGFKIAR